MKTSLKILITGPESSGKTMLANHLKVYLNGFLVKEYAREFFNTRKLTYTDDDLLKIAKEQLFRIQEAVKKQDIIICDTGPFVLNLWWDEKATAQKPTWLSAAVTETVFDVVLLCKPDIPWEPDPLRENPNDRERLYDLYMEQLKKHHIPFCTIEGHKEKRLKDALFAIRDSILRRQSNNSTVKY